MSAPNKYPSQLADRFIVRLPEGMHDKLAAAAEASGRSMNSEVIARLEASFSPLLNIPHDLRTALDKIAVRDGISFNAALRKAVETGIKVPDVLYVLLDSHGHPISWHEIHEYASALKKAAGLNVVEARYQIITPDMESSSRRAAEVVALAKKLRAKGRSQVIRAPHHGAPAAPTNEDLNRSVNTLNAGLRSGQVQVTMPDGTEAAPGSLLLSTKPETPAQKTVLVGTIGRDPPRQTQSQTQNTRAAGAPKIAPPVAKGPTKRSKRP